MKKYRVVLPVATLVFMGGACMNAPTISAYNTNSNPYSSLVERLSDKFGLDPQEVESVFSEDQSAQHAEYLQRIEERLSDAVQAEKITEAQKQAILEKQAELRAQRAEWQSLLQLSPEERLKKRQEIKEELKTWSEEHDIDLHYLFINQFFDYGGVSMKLVQ